MARIEQRTVNYVSVTVQTETGCNVSEGEYGIMLCSSSGYLDLHGTGGPTGGSNDIDLIRECINEHIGDYDLPEEGCTEFMLRESGEREDVFWHKYYVIERVGDMGGC